MKVSRRVTEYAPQSLLRSLQQVLPHAQLERYRLPELEQLSLWLIDDIGSDRPLSEKETDSVWETPPYWSFCWGSGQAQALWIKENSSLIEGKTVIDFGCGSAVVGIAAARAGAARVIACDLDPSALLAARYNAQLNGVTLELCDDLFSIDTPADWLFAADVLYDPDNLPLVERLPDFAAQVLLADSRIKNFSHQAYTQVGQRHCVTLPDLGENEDVKTVRFYLSE